MPVIEQPEDGAGRCQLGGLMVPALHAPCATFQKRSLRRQIERAADVQRSLLPDVSTPVGPFRLASLYWPCEMLGGDFYDLAWRQDSAVLLVSDVMGHGLDAALITMLVKGAFQEAAAGTGAPVELLTEMHVRLRRVVPERVFVAAAVARLSLEDYEVELANAGLPHPFVLRASGQLEELALDGLPLGLFDTRTAKAHDACRVQLGSADVLLVASDGIGSVKCEDGRTFEERHLRRALKTLAGHDGRYVIDRLAAEAVTCAGGRPLGDDINLVAVSRNGSGFWQPDP